MFDLERTNKFLNKNNMNEPILVEGIKDKKCLSKLGFKNVYPISGKSVPEIIDELSLFRSIVILTDFDAEGKKKAKLLNKLFESHGIKINTKFRYDFFSVFRIYKVEELKGFFKFSEKVHFNAAANRLV